MAQKPVSGGRFVLVVAAAVAVGAAALAWQVLGARSAGIPADVTIAVEDTVGFRGYVLGRDDAPVEVVEYADYQCPACQTFENVQFPDVRGRLVATGRLRWRFRDFPLDQHPHARTAAHAAACADEQGRFWELHHRIFEEQQAWARERDAAGRFRDYAKALGVDLGRYDECMRSARHAGRIRASAEEGLRLGVNSTPTFLIGGRLYPGVLSYDAIRRLTDSLAAVAGR